LSYNKFSLLEESAVPILLKKPIANLEQHLHWGLFGEIPFSHVD
jgi:hypothetical protein